MDEKTIKDKVYSSFKMVLPGIKNLSDTSNSRDSKEWDSLRHIMLITDIEKTFDITFELDELLSMQSFGEICRMVAKKLSDEN